MRHVPPEVRRLAHELVKDCMARNYLSVQNEFFNLSERKPHGNLSISQIYALLLVSPTAFENAWGIVWNSYGQKEATKNKQKYKHALRAFDLLRSLQKLVLCTQYIPGIQTDSTGSISDYNDSDGQTRLIRLRKMAEEYVEKLATFCRMSSDANTVLGKPNVHRLVELHNFTLPAFGSVKIIQELVLKKAH